jgi:hypothetical protein
MLNFGDVLFEERILFFEGLNAGVELLGLELLKVFELILVVFDLVDFLDQFALELFQLNLFCCCLFTLDLKRVQQVILGLYLPLQHLNPLL